MWEKYKKIIIIALVIVLIFLIWAIFVKPKDNTEELIVTNISSDINGFDVKIVKSLEKIDSLKLKESSASLFANPILSKLIDYSRPIKIHRVGRSNPFEKIGKISAVSSPTSTPRTNLSTPPTPPPVPRSGS